MASSLLGLPPCVKQTGAKRGAPGPLIVTTSDEDSSDGEAIPLSGRGHVSRVSPRSNVTSITDTYPSLKLDLSRALTDKLLPEAKQDSHRHEIHRHEKSEVRQLHVAHTARAASPSPEAGFSAHRQACDGYEHDHDYENVASPSGSSTASGPVYVRPPGFQHHAQEIRRKKKKSNGLLERREGLKSRAPTPPKVKPRRGEVIFIMRQYGSNFKFVSKGIIANFLSSDGCCMFLHVRIVYHSTHFPIHVMTN